MKSRSLMIAAGAGLLSFLGLAIDASEAHAATVVRSLCVIRSVALDGDDPTSRLFIDADCAEGHVGVYGYLNRNCSVTAVNASQQTFEGWRSIAQAAFLSGRKVTMIYETGVANCGNAMYSLNIY